MRVYFEKIAGQSILRKKHFPFKEKKTTSQRNDKSAFEKTTSLLLILNLVQTCFKHPQFIPDTYQQIALS
jgi:hypothetical protein